jgi:hypothetical protein
MSRAKVAVTVCIGAVLILSAATLTASDPVGIYAIVEKVIFEPGEAMPQRVQIWGMFSLADTARGGDFYTKPQHGYLYYTLPAGKEQIARREWSDLKAVAGTGEGVAFGARYSPLGKIRLDTDKLDSPDLYNVGGTGVTKVNPAPGYQSNMTDIVGQLKAALKSR